MLRYLAPLFVFFAQTSWCEISLQLGQGEAVVEFEGAAGQPEQFDFTLKNPELIQLLNSSDIYQFNWEDPILESQLRKTVGENNQLAAALSESLLTLVKANNFEKQSMPVQGAIFSNEEKSQRVVMGSYALIGNQERLQELVVVGGKVDLQGEAESLVVIGGFVNLMPGAIVTRELVIVGGHVKEDPGSQVLGKRVDLSMPGGDEAWGILRDKIKNTFFKDLNDNFLLRLFGFSLKFLVLILFFVIGQYWAPRYHLDVQSYLQNHFLLASIWGILTVILILPLTLFLTLSIIGIPLLPLQFSLLFLFAIFGEVHIAQFLVRKIPALRKKIYWSTILGLFLMEFAAYFLGLSILKWTLVLIGFGATSKVFYKRTLPSLSKV